MVSIMGKFLQAAKKSRCGENLFRSHNLSGQNNLSGQYNLSRQHKAALPGAAVPP